MQIEVRKLNDNDVSFILSTITDQQCSLRHYRKCPRRFMKQGLNHLVKTLLQEAQTSVACSSEDPNQIYAYLIYDKNLLHFAYTKMIYRRFGIINKLIGDKKFESYSFNSDDKIFTEFAQKRKMAFNPWWKYEN
jgi:hypothetical protein